MDNEATFPVLHADIPGHKWRARYPDCPHRLPLAAVHAHERQAMRNHGGQDVATLKSRGGLDPVELYYVLTDQTWPFPFSNHIPEDEVVAFLVCFVRDWEGKDLAEAEGT